MSTQHTPGPWQIHVRDSHPQHVDIDEIIITQQGQLTPVAFLSPVFLSCALEKRNEDRAWEIAVQEVKSNAELIAAAPDLLRELIVAHLIIRNAALIMEPEQLSRWVEINNLKTGTLRHSEREVVITKAEGGEA